MIGTAYKSEVCANINFCQDFVNDWNNNPSNESFNEDHQRHKYLIKQQSFNRITTPLQ